MRPLLPWPSSSHIWSTGSYLLSACRLAVIDSLERLALSVLEQLVDAIAPEATEQLNISSQQHVASHVSVMQKVKVVLVKRASETKCVSSRLSTFSSCSD